MSEPAVLVRHFNFPPEDVYAAWVDPEQLREWFANGEDLVVEEASLDVRPGGEFRIRLYDGEDHMCAFGTYQRVEPPNLLQFTWKWEESSIEKGESLVTVELKGSAGQTQLTLTHERLSSPKSIEAHTAGWTSLVTRLGAFLGK